MTEWPIHQFGRSLLHWFCFPCVPVDGYHGEAAAAAAWEGIWRHLLPWQDAQHASLPSKEVGDQAHELEQGDGVIAAQRDTFREEQQRTITRQGRLKTCKTCLEFHFIQFNDQNERIKLSAQACLWLNTVNTVLSLFCVKTMVNIHDVTDLNSM